MIDDLDQRRGWTLFFDGLCEPRNPGGTIAYGVLLTSPDEDQIPLSGTMPAAPTNTNNVSEWIALGKGLAYLSTALESRTASPRNVQIFGDSKLVICQFTNAWACRQPHLQKLRDRCQELARQIAGQSGQIVANWIPREQNAAADALGRKAYFAATGKLPLERVKGVA